MTDNTDNHEQKSDFKKVINDLVSDILTTFPELKDKLHQTSNIEQLKIKSELVGLEAIHNERGLGGFYTLEAKKV